MILHTVFPLEQVLEEPHNEKFNFIEMKYAGMTIIVQPFNSTSGKLIRLISVNPNDYLNPQYQPGTIVYFTPQLTDSAK